MTKKIYLSELKNTQHDVFEEIQDFLEEDENGDMYFTDKEEAEWWQDLFNALEKIEDKKRELTREEVVKLERNIDKYFNELDDYIQIAENLDDYLEK